MLISVSGLNKYFGENHILLILILQLKKKADMVLLELMVQEKQLF